MRPGDRKGLLPGNEELEPKSKNRGIPRANSGVAIGGPKAEKSPTATAKRYRSRSCVERAAGTDVFLIPKEHFAKETLEQGHEGWGYQVRSVIRTEPGVPKM